MSTSEGFTSSLAILPIHHGESPLTGPSSLLLLVRFLSPPFFRFHSDARPLVPTSPKYWSAINESAPVIGYRCCQSDAASGGCWGCPRLAVCARCDWSDRGGLQPCGLFSARPRWSPSSSACVVELSLPVRGAIPGIPVCVTVIGMVWPV